MEVVGSGLIPGAPGPGKAKGQHRVEQSLEKGSTGFHPNPGQPTNISCPQFLHLYNSPFLLHKDGLQIGSSTVPGHIQALIREEWTHTCICMYIHMYACMCACMYTLMHTHIYTSVYVIYISLYIYIYDVSIGIHIYVPSYIHPDMGHQTAGRLGSVGRGDTARGRLLSAEEGM